MQFRGDFTPNDPADADFAAGRPGDGPGSKVTYNGVQIGRVTGVDPIERDGTTKAKLSLDVDPKYIALIPANAIAEVKASTVFGNKYVSFRSPPDPTKQRISSKDVIDVSHVTTEFNTLFETLTSISEKVDPVKLNLTLSAAAEALDGLGTKFGQSIVNGNAVLDDVNPQMPQIRTNIQQLSKLADVYTKASPDLWDFLDHAVTTARTLNAAAEGSRRRTAGLHRLRQHRRRHLRTRRPLLRPRPSRPDPHRRNCWTPTAPKSCAPSATTRPSTRRADSAGGNGYSIDFHIGLTGAPNPYVYPDNLPRVNAKGGPGGAPGCWQPVTHDFWPAPFLVADYGASLAPYNHFELGQPILTEYVWGRQVGENTINP